ncbi:MAG: helix-hairpin-helix domain-containing protein [Chloroflexi bacterium]|nr:helix-hairpin-helix domain-containing protein [Chloroflexota bacterium]MYJ92393.1 helix-hairpin-helix domain-containing protein [Chloroflexota bacterium]
MSYRPWGQFRSTGGEMPIRLEIRPPGPPKRVDGDARSRWPNLRRRPASWLPMLFAVAMALGALGSLAVQQSQSQIDPVVRAAQLPTEARPALIDLNAATIAELSTLPGIGDRRAEAIVLVRSERPFVSLADLVERGILRPPEALAIAEFATVYVSRE